ncbi:DUF3396 domain-containing protein [Moraxella sp. FZLJ2107]|uniref:type VI immunity family protein n=1 Tax=unclassified Moraxella TaxID=2685852 RepID=UPI0020C87D42|nr:MULTISPECIES: type VI immunity family protein [unclassified Moraxella]UTO05429.1 DUF3396 domain-containing protein [Moraxella sp. FZLJ2107]UTO22165.1 DUF3396 domain-containing protein [Moraxella sp. FZLJ2109]
MKTLEEMNEYKEDFHYYDVINDKEVTVNDVHLTACLFFRDGHLPEVREQLRDCIDQYMALFGEHITWGFNPKNRRWKEKPFDKLPSFNEILQERKDPDDIIEWFVSAGSHQLMEEAVPYELFCMTERDWKLEDISQLRFRVDRADFFNPDKQVMIVNLFNYCIHKLNPYFAYMGLGSAIGYEEQYSIDLLNQAKQFFGINIIDTWDAVVMHHGIRSIDWWTYISDDLAQRIGGRDKLLEQITAKSVAHKIYDNGVLLIADEVPQLLPIDKPIPQSYLDINDICRPMRNGRYGSLTRMNQYDGGVGRQTFNAYFTDLWLRRFDNPELWRTFPQQTTSDITAEPIKTATGEITTLNTGEVCQQDGRYIYLDEYDYNRKQFRHHNIASDGRLTDYRQYVVLKKGDIAPYFIHMDANWRTVEAMKIAWTLVEVL